MGENRNLNIQVKLFWSEEERKRLGKELKETKEHQERTREDLERKIVRFLVQSNCAMIGA